MLYLKFNTISLGTSSRTCRRCIYVSLFLFLHVAQLFSQGSRFQFEKLTVEDGLSQSSIWSIFQDQQGFMWFGTADGLNRYDGYNFKIFRHDPEDERSLPSNTISTITEDRNGDLWFGTPKGIVRYNRPTRSFKRLNPDPKSFNTFLGDNSNKLYCDGSGIIWVTSTMGFAKIDPSNEAVKFIDSPLQLHGPLIKPMAEDEKGALWIATNQDIFMFDKGSEKFTEIKVPYLTAKEIISYLYFDHSGMLWVSSAGGGLLQYNPRTSQWNRFLHDPGKSSTLSDNYVRAVVEDDQGKIWIGTQFGGLNIFDRASQSFSRFVPSADERSNARYEGAIQLYTDRSHLIWVGYDGSGIVKINPHPNMFHHVLLPPSEGRATGDNFFKSAMIDHSGTIWLGTYDQGVDIFDRSTGKVTRFAHNHKDTNSINSNTVFALLQDRTGTGWIGTNAGLDEYDPVRKRFIHYAAPQYSHDDIRPMFITSLCEQSDGIVWGGGHGLVKIDRNMKRMELVPVAQDGNWLTRNPNIETLKFDNDSVLWIGTLQQGLFRFNIQSKTSEHFLHDPLKENSLSNDVVKTICKDSSGKVWIGTAEGLNRFDPVSKQWRRYYQKDGLPNDFIYGILITSRQHLWISTNRGLSDADMHDPDHPRFRNYTPDDGLQSYEFNTGVYFKTPDGEMLFGGVNGFNIFYPDSIRDNPNIPNIALTGFKKFDVPSEINLTEGTSPELRLEYLESVFSFEFSALEFTNPRRNQYAYIMEGFDKNWTYAGTRREARYTNLDPGSYMFRVRGSNNSGIWNSEGASIRVVIVPPFWRTSWFLTLASLLGFGLIVGSVRFISMRKLRKRIILLQQQQALERERVRIAKDMHDELGASLTRISLLSEIAKNNGYDAHAVAGNLQKISDAARTVVQNLDEIVWAVNPQNDTLDSLALYLTEYTSVFFEQLNIRCRFDFPPHIPRTVLSSDARHNIFLTIKESLTNIVKHASASEVTVSLQIIGGHVRIEVHDNGKGFDEKMATSLGNGVENMKRRIQEIHGVFAISSDPGQGTTVTVSFSPDHA